MDVYDLLLCSSSQFCVEPCHLTCEGKRLALLSSIEQWLMMTTSHITGLTLTDAIITRLPRRPPSSHMRSLFNEAGPSHPATFAADEWQLRWNNSNSKLKTVYMPKSVRNTTRLPFATQGMARLNRIRCGHGRFNAALHKWGLCESPLCRCGVLQTDLSCHL